MAGIVGTESEIESLDAMWAEYLAAPLGGRKPPLRRFHMYDCHNSLNEFAGWSRTETDYFCHQLREVIIRSHVSGYGFACARQDWNQIIQNEYRTIFGDPEGYAVRNCINCALNWAHNSTFDPHMSFVFDDRPEREVENRAVFDLYQRILKPPELVGISFMTSHKVTLASRRFGCVGILYACKQRLTPREEAGGTQRAVALVTNMSLYGQMATKDAIQEMKARVLRDEKEKPEVRGIFEDIRRISAERLSSP